MNGIKEKIVRLHEQKHVKKYGFSLKKGEEGDMLVAKSSLHCDCRGGKLKCGVGYSTYLRNNAAITYRNENAREIFIAKTLGADGVSYTEGFFVAEESGMLYAYDSSTKTFKMKTTCGDNSHFCSAIDSDKKVVNAIGAKGKLALMDDQLVVASTGLKGTGAVCFYRHRLFCGVQPNLLYYSAPNDWTNFEESIDDGGWVNFGHDYGEIVSLIVFRDQLYVFFERAIFRLQETGSARYFAPEQIPYRGGVIFGRTVGVCGNAVFFLTKDGIYRFDGTEVKFINTGITINEEYAQKKFGCAGYNGKMCIRYYDKNNEGKTIVIYEDGKSWYFTGEMRGLSQADGRAMALNNTMLAFLDDNGVLPIDKQYYFNDCETDFGTSKRKRITKIRFIGEGVFDFTLRNRGRIIEKSFTFKDGYAEFDLQERGDKFGVDIRLYQGAKVHEMAVEYYTLK